MGVLSLHNECPPSDYGVDEAKAICHGLAIGEEGTSAALKALADCLNALAAMDDTVGYIVTMWSVVASGNDAAGHNGAESHNGSGRGIDVRESYVCSFEALSQTASRIDLAIQKYRALSAYARSATEAGRGHDFQAALLQTAGEDFDTLICRRIEGLRKLKVRVKVLTKLQEYGAQTLMTYNFPEFFLLFMQPLRDLAISVNELYSEIVRGALASHQALFRVGQLAGWDENGTAFQPSQGIPQSVSA